MENKIHNYLDSRMNTISILLSHAQKMALLDTDVSTELWELAELFARQVESYRDMILSMDQAQMDKQNIINALDTLLETFPRISTEQVVTIQSYLLDHPDITIRIFEKFRIFSLYDIPVEHFSYILEETKKTINKKQNRKNSGVIIK